MDYSDNFSQSPDHFNELTHRFEEMVAKGDSSYYEVDDLEMLLDHYIVNHRLEMAFKVVEVAREQYPNTSQLSIKEAELLSMTDKHQEALELLKAIEMLEGFNPEYYLTKASVLSHSGEYQKAIVCLHKALDCSESDIDVVYMNLAIEHQNLQQYAQAIEYLKKSLEINILNEDALYEIAYCFELTKQYEEAVKYFLSFINTHPYSSHAWFNLGAMYQALNNYEKAAVAFDYVIIIDEEFHAAYFNKANVLVKLEQYGPAIELYKKALAFEILDSLIYFYIGDCYDHLEDYKNAHIFFEKSLRKDDTMAESWIGASNALDMLGRELEALEYAKKAIQLDPDNEDYWCYQAGLQQKYNLPVESSISYEKGIELGGQEAQMFEDYASLALSMKDEKLLHKILQQGLELHTNNELLRLYESIHYYLTGKEDIAFEKLVEVLIKNSSLINEFLIHFPQGMEFNEIQFLVESLQEKS